MYSFFDIQFWLFAVWFIVVSAVIFLLPGYFVVKKLQVSSSLMSFLLSLVLGMVLWGVQGYTFGYLQIRILSYVYVAFFLYWGIHNRKEIAQIAKKTWEEIKQLDRVVIGLVVVGLFLQLLPMVASGMRFTDGIRFYFVNEADGIMHLSYIQSIIRSFPPQEPGAIGLPLVNYHYWTDLVVADLSRVFALPVAHMFFQYFPFFIALVTGLLVYTVVRIWGGSVVTARWALFLLYFSGDAAYSVYYLLHQSISFHTPAIDNGITQFFNMPHAFAKMIFLAGLIPLHLWITTKKRQWGILTVAYLATLVGFKVYFGMFAAIGFALVVGWRYASAIFEKGVKGFSFSHFWKGIYTNRVAFLLLFIFALVSSLIYFPPNSGSGGLIFSPLEWPKLLLGEQALNFREWWLRMQVYEQAGNIRNVFVFNVLALGIAFVSIHGTRLIGFLPNKSLYKNLRIEGLLFFIPAVLLFTFLGFFTLQESGLFNVFNFFVVSLVVLSLFSSFTLSDVSQRKSLWAKAFLFLFILVTIPRVTYEAFSFIQAYSDGKYRLISNDELEALEYLRKETKKGSVVQSHPENALDSITPYVSYFSNRSTYFTGGGLLATHNQPIEKREEVVMNAFLEPNVTEFASTLRSSGITHVYLLKKDEERMDFGEEPPHLTTVFENDSVVIYSVFQESL